MRLVRRLLALGPADRQLLAEAWLRLVVVATVLQWAGYSRISQRVPSCRPRQVRADDLIKARRYARWIASAARRQPLRALCLAQSLALHAWLRGEGVPSELRIGVVKADARLAAHAWVELDGVPVNDAPSSVAAFTPLARARGVAPDLHQQPANAAPAVLPTC